MSEIQHSSPGPVSDAVGYTLHKTVVMVGMMGAGKTAVGRALAARLGVAFLDSDTEIESAANLTIPEIFARDGEGFFRSKETQVIQRLLLGKPGILSTGGGAFLSAQNRAAISDHGVALWLQVDLELLWQRVRHKNTRPLLQTADPRRTLAELYEQRVPIYAQADLRVKAEAGLPIEQMVDRVIAELGRHKEILQVKNGN